jgi:hypothetical protein
LGFPISDKNVHLKNQDNNCLVIHGFEKELVKPIISDLRLYQTLDKQAPQRIIEQLVEMEVPKTRNRVT